MLIVPEIETVVILVPRTGTGALRRALRLHYPQAMQVYRHMEADGVPHGYNRWRRVGLVRDPLDRLWSLYKFLQRFDGPHDPDYLRAMRESVQLPFERWLLNNDIPFTTPYDRGFKGRFWPQYTVLHSIPENRKSQFVYLRPDLGTEVYGYAEAHRLWTDLGLYGDEMFDRQINATSREPLPDLSPAARDYVAKVFAWDIAEVQRLHRAAGGL